MHSEGCSCTWTSRARRLFLGPGSRGTSGCTVLFQLVGNPWKFHYQLDLEGARKCREMSAGARRLKGVPSSGGDHGPRSDALRGAQGRGRGLWENRQVKGGGRQSKKRGELGSCTGPACEEGGTQGTVLQSQVVDMVRNIKS